MYEEIGYISDNEYMFYAIYENKAIKVYEIFRNDLIHLENTDAANIRYNRLVYTVDNISECNWNNLEWLHDTKQALTENIINPDYEYYNNIEINFKEFKLPELLESSYYIYCFVFIDF